MSNDADILKDFVDALDKNIEDLKKINNKVGYNPDYDEGYSDACVAIRNTMHTMCNIRTRGY